MKKITFALAGLVSVIALEANAETYRYNHNNSAMKVDVFGQNVIITYENPRSSLEKNGVRRGTVLFNGKIELLDNGQPYLEGDAKVFRQGCEPTPYYVYGNFNQGQDFKLNGAAPVLANAGCSIVDNVYTGSNANLFFSAVQSGNGNKPSQALSNNSQKLGWSKVCVTGVNTSLNLRTGPGVDYGRIGELPANACDVIALNQCIKTWCAVQRRNEIGWVSRKYLRVQ